MPSRHVVSAVVVSHNGERWLGELIAGLRQQRRPAERVLCVDTGSTDASRDMLSRGFSPQAVLTCEPTTGFGAAVAQALRHLPPVSPREGSDVVEWLWLLHDDCAPTPGALREMLMLLEEVPAAAVIGPKLRSWPRGRQLLELGVSITGSGKRETGMEYGEFDQGQHDIVRETLAVSTAGMLVRRDVFERLGGFDPALGLFRDDIDFGWRVHRAGYHVITCPDAIVFHAEVGSRGARKLDAAKGVRPRLVDRKAANYTLLANCSLWLLPFVAIRMVFGAVLRTLGLLIAKWPDAAYDEFLALLSMVGRPDRIVRGRLRRARGRKVPRRKFRHLFPPPWVGIQHALETVTGVLSTSNDTGSHAGSRRRRKAVETGPVSEEAEELEAAGPGRIVRSFTKPPVLLVVLLTLVSLVAGRQLLTGGALSGGALLAAPDGAMALWQRYVESWHPVDLGSGRAAPPYLAVVAFVGTLCFGNVDVAVGVLTLGAIPLSGLTAYLLAAQVLRARPVRLWAAGTYALIPACTGAVAGGRLGTCVAVILLPLLGITVLRMFGRGSWSATWTSALLLGIITAFVPMAYPIAVVLGVVAALTWRPQGRVAERVAVMLITAPLLLLPWIPTLVQNPSLWLAEAGRTVPELADPQLPGYALALGSPGGPGAAPFWLLGALGPVALVALLRRDRVRGTVAAWMITGLGVLVGLVQSRLVIDMDWLPFSMPAWPGFAAALVIGGWVAALAYSADGVAQIFSAKSFTWRQPMAAVLAFAVVVIPVVGVGWFVVQGAADPLKRTEVALPEYISTAQQSGDRPRVLMLEATDDVVRYTLLRGDGARLGDAETGSSRATMRYLGATLSELLGDANREDAAETIAAYGIGFVYLPVATDDKTTQRLDTTPGLVRASAPEGAAAWTVPQRAPVTLESNDTVRDLGTRPSVEVPPDASGRLVLAEAYDAGWHATLDGQPLDAVRDNGWAQAFELPEGGGRVEISYDAGLQGRLLPLQGVLALLVVLLAVPSRARRNDGPVYAEAGKHGLAADFVEATPERPDGAKRSAPISDRLPEEVRR